MLIFTPHLSISLPSTAVPHTTHSLPSHPTAAVSRLRSNLPRPHKPPPPCSPVPSSIPSPRCYYIATPRGKDTHIIAPCLFGFNPFFLPVDSFVRAACLILGFDFAAAAWSTGSIDLEEEQSVTVRKRLMEKEPSLVAQNRHGIMAEEEEDELGTPSSSSEEESSNSTRSSSSDFMDDATSPSSSSASSHDDRCPLYQMSDLMAELPIKRGLSKYFQGKSQSFTSLSSARCLEDLVKPERPHSKKLKTCKSYAAGLDGQNQKSPLPMGCSSRTISKRPSKASLASLVAKRSSTRPPVPPPHRSVSFSGQTLLFA